MAQYFNNMTTILYVLNADSGRKVFTSTKLNLDLNLYSSKNGSLSVKHTTKFINNNTLKEGGHIMLLYVYKSVLGLYTLLHLNATVVAMQPKKFLNRARYFFTGLGYKVYTRKNTLFV